MAEFANAVVGVGGDGVDAPFFRNGAGSAAVEIRAECIDRQRRAEGHGAETLWELAGVRIELGDRSAVAVRVADRGHHGVYAASLGVAGLSGPVAGRVVCDVVETAFDENGVPAPGHDSQDTKPFSATVTPDEAAPQITVTPEAQEDGRAGTVLHVAVTDPVSGLDGPATWEIDGLVAATELVPDPATGSTRIDVDYRALTGTSEDVPCPPSWTVVLRARDRARPAANVATLDVPVGDTTGPALAVRTPVDGVRIIDRGSGVDVEISGEASDHWSGVATIEVRLDDELVATPKPAQPAVRHDFSVPVHIDAPGQHTVSVLARDAAGRQTPRKLTFVVATAFSGAAARDPFGLGSYLADLLDFAGRSVAVPLYPGAEPAERDRRRLVAVEIARVFHQPVLPASRAPDARSGVLRNGVRAGVEAFERVLDATRTDLVAHWPLDAGSGSVAEDASGNGFAARTGTGGALSWTDGRAGGRALHLGGAADELVVGAPGALTMHTEVSIAAWVRADAPGSAGDYAIILNKENEYEIGRSPDGELGVAFAHAAAGGVWTRRATGIALPEGEWVHVAVVHDGERTLAYRNGRVADRSADGGPLGSPTPALHDVRIGGRQAGAARLAGALADLRVYRGAVPGAVVARLAGRAPALRAHWPLARRAGSPVPDEVAGLGLAVTGGGWDSGPGGDALVLGPGDHAETGDDPAVALGVDDADFTLCARILVADDPAPGSRAVLTAGAADAPGVEIVLHGEVAGAAGHALGLRVRTGAGTVAGPAGTAPVPGGRWTHVACVKDGDRLALYVEGAVRLVHRLGAVAGTAGPLRLGSSDAAGGLVGRIADVRVHDAALTDPELAALVSGTDAARAAYRRAAHRALLVAQGTSHDELRLLRTAERARREAVAARLGIVLRAGRPDELDELLGSGGGADGGPDEAWLEDVFGLAATAGDPLRPHGPARLARWRRDALRAAWRAQDEAAPAAVDPVVVDDDDVAPTAPDADASAVRALLAARRSERHEHRMELAAARDGATGPEAFATTLTAGLGVGPDRLAELRDQRGAGRSVAAELAALHLTPGGFERLLVLGELATASGLDATDLAELDDVLLEVHRRERQEAWRGEERTAIGGRPVVLSPDLFAPRVRPTDPLTAPEAAAARRAWEDRLATRVEQDSAGASALAAGVADVEDLVLPALRDALAVPAAAVLGCAEGDALSRRLLLDAAVGPSRTSVAQQAVSLVGGVLFALRAGRIEDTHPAGSWALRAPADLDRGMPWMESLAAWQSAMAVFYYPQTLLLPSLRRVAEGNTAYPALIDALRARTGSVAVRVDDALTAYTQGRAADPAFAAAYRPDPARADEHRRVNDEAAGRFAEGTTAPPSEVLVEVLYLVPLAVALALHRWGAHTEALDWFRLVYDDTAEPARRAVYAGLRAERNVAPEFSRDDDWLDDLHPHRLAVAQKSNAYTRYTLAALTRCLLDFGDAEFARDTEESITRARTLYLTAREVLRAPELRAPPADLDGLPPDPAQALLVLRVENQLRKLRQGRNIAGMARPEPAPVTPGTVPTAATVGADGTIRPPSRVVLRPTGHRYAVLVERARRMVTLAGQVEAAYLQALAQKEAEAYRELEARQHLELAGRGVELQRLRLTQASSSTQLAQRRQARVAVTRATYGAWLDADLNEYELLTIGAYIAGGVAQSLASHLRGAASVAQTAVTAAGASLPGAPVAAAAAATFGVLTVASTIENDAAIAAQTTASVASLKGTYERRRDEWELQRDLADKDLLISEQEIHVAQDQEAIGASESLTAVLAQQQAEALATYLATRVLSAELYGWMAGVLRDVYAYFLQQATATAVLAQRQLAFERQQPPVEVIAADYWAAPDPDAAGATPPPDRVGLTGSARLLQDIEELDQHAFETDRRKLNLTQTFSLAARAPVEFERFRETGVLPFTITHADLDRAFPGHYLRLVRRARVSMIALVPAVTGIRATLTASGVSRVMVGGDSGFTEVVIRREPEQVALTSPADASGVFDLDLQPDLLAPFESMGMAASWELRMPRPANPANLRDVADVLVTFDYTALADPDLARSVIAELPRRAAVELALRLRVDRPDQWYELHHPAEAATPYTVRFDTARTEFPHHLDDLAVSAVTLAVTRADGTSGPVEIDHLTLAPAGETGAPLGGAATSSPDGVVSTRRSTGSAWTPMVGRSPVGSWELAFTDALAPLVEAGALAEVLLVVGVTGTTAAWPD